MMKYIKLLRVRHYMKNLLVFAALACSGRLLRAEKLLPCACGFAAFCAASSAVYIVNDIRDRERDRLHPVKRARPVASGAVTLRRARFLAAAAALAAALCDALAAAPSASPLLAGYLALNLAYSFGLKNVPLADVSILAAGFLLRLLYGARITGTPSPTGCT